MLFQIDESRLTFNRLLGFNLSQPPLLKKAHSCGFAVALVASVLLTFSSLALATVSEIDRLIQVLDFKPDVAVRRRCGRAG